MGLDVGDRRTGVALSDELGITARPLKTLKRRSREKDYRELLEIIKEYSVEEVVVGVPINLDGTRGERALKVQAFAEGLRERTAARVSEWDERFSTAAVTRVLIEADLSRNKRKEVVDRAAAVYILQGFLDHLRSATVLKRGLDSP